MPEAIKPPGATPFAATRAAAILTALSVLSPLSGLVMEMALAWRYGVSGTVDAFRISALVLGLGTQLFFGYLLPHVVVPLFSECRAKGLEKEGWQLAFSIAIVSSVIAIVFAGWVWFSPDALVGLLGPGLSASARDDAQLFMRFFSLAFLLMVWSGVLSGIFYVYRIFWLSAVAQLLPNLLVVLIVIVAGSAQGAGALALGVLLGYVAMLLMFFWGLTHIVRDARIRLSECLKWGGEEGLRKALRLSIPLLATILLGQWGIIVINRVLSEMPPGTLAEFGYAWKLLVLTSLLPAGLATVIFPAFSETHANENLTEFSRLVMRAFRMTLFLTIPLAALLIVERIPVVYLVFGRGGMPPQAIADTGLIFGILLIGAPAGALSAVLSKIAFAMHDTRSPAVIALISVLAISGLVPYAASTGGVAGVVAAFSAISWGGSLLLLGYLIRRYRIVRVTEVFRSAGVLSALGMGVAFPAILLRALFGLYEPLSFNFALLEMALSGLVCITTAYGLSRMLGVHEASEIARYINWQLQQIPLIRSVINKRST